MAMGKDKIKGIFVKPFVKTSWVIKEVTCRPTRFQKKRHSRFLRTLSHSNIKCTNQGLNIERKACVQRISGLVFDTDYPDLKETMTVQN